MTEPSLTEKLTAEIWHQVEDGCPRSNIAKGKCCGGPGPGMEQCKTCWADALLALIQPEIDRARVEGRREVVEWVHNHSIGVTAENEIKNNPLWQSKLKAWGLEAQE